MAKKSLSNDKTDIALIGQDIGYIKQDISTIKANIQNGYVTKEEFQPVKNVVYGLVAIIMIAVVGALLALVVKK